MAFRRRRSRVKHVIHHHVKGFKKRGRRYGMRRRRSGSKRRTTFISGQRF